MSRLVWYNAALEEEDDRSESRLSFPPLRWAALESARAAAAFFAAMTAKLLLASCAWIRFELVFQVTFDIA